MKGCIYYKGLKDKQMAIVKKKRGRPAGTGHGQQVVHKLRHGFEGALAELEIRGKSLDILLADALELDVNSTIRSMAALLPKDVDISVSAGDSLSDALRGVADKLASDKADKAKQAEIIDGDFTESD